ncbi:uncharacterized protein EDB93DRAFT_1249609 [Suillus bovinus]|uniref:uncharacterized protein n=1 Tax=Suillus bovinus TaxID=48563 RepID=UPI001B8680D8|nr:uncharacterized protein EDB93DRAFT_1249609 [Suillus bovinus]KAG2151121.1 hypothetical protein EDB93DRAFT_1249609 [Suillus bovinus]
MKRASLALVDDIEDERVFKLRKKTVAIGIGELYDPGLVPDKLKMKKGEPMEPPPASLRTAAVNNINMGAQGALAKQHLKDNPVLKMTHLHKDKMTVSLTAYGIWHIEPSPRLYAGLLITLERPIQVHAVPNGPADSSPRTPRISDFLARREDSPTAIRNDDLGTSTDQHDPQQDIVTGQINGIAPRER